MVHIKGHGVLGKAEAEHQLKKARILHRRYKRKLGWFVAAIATSLLMLMSAVILGVVQIGHQNALVPMGTVGLCGAAVSIGALLSGAANVKRGQYPHETAIDTASELEDAEFEYQKAVDREVERFMQNDG